MVLCGLLFRSAAVYVNVCLNDQKARTHESTDFQCD